MPRRNVVKKSAESFKVTAENFMLLARQLETTKVPPEQTAQKAALLNDAKQAVALIGSIMRKADDLRTWAHDAFGVETDNVPLAQFAAKQLANSVNATLGFQTYRIRTFLKSGRVESPRTHLRGNLVASLAASLLNEVTKQ